MSELRSVYAFTAGPGEKLYTRTRVGLMSSLHETYLP